MGLIKRIKRALPKDITPPPLGVFAPPSGPIDLEAAFNPAMPHDELTLPFDPSKQKVYCSHCGRELVLGGHMFREGLMCPQHGEFTIAPMVTKYRDGWAIEFHDETEKGMWETCNDLTETDSPDGHAQVGRLATDEVDTF